MLQSIIGTNTVSLSAGHEEQMLVTFESKYNNFRSIKCIWKCVCQISTILSQPRCVYKQRPGDVCICTGQWSGSYLVHPYLQTLVIFESEDNDFHSTIQENIHRGYPAMCKYIWRVGPFWQDTIDMYFNMSHYGPKCRSFCSGLNVITVNLW